MNEWTNQSKISDSELEINPFCTECNLCNPIQWTMMYKINSSAVLLGYFFQIDCWWCIRIDFNPLKNRTNLLIINKCKCSECSEWSDKTTALPTYHTHALLGNAFDRFNEVDRMGLVASGMEVVVFEIFFVYTINEVQYKVCSQFWNTKNLPSVAFSINKSITQTLHVCVSTRFQNNYEFWSFQKAKMAFLSYKVCFQAKNRKIHSRWKKEKERKERGAEREQKMHNLLAFLSVDFVFLAATQ